ncbi:MAG: hypothetical protein ABH830_01960 [Patescibacteria group bacterium]
MKKLIFLCFFALILSACTLFGGTNVDIGPEEASAKAENFINNNLLQEGQKATVKEVTEEGGLYKVVVDIGSGQDVDSYITKDGKKFFPQVLDIEEIEGQNNQDTSAEPQPDINAVKSEKPVVELFVMSHCPYGTQIEKGMLPVIETLGDKIDFSLKFCSYAMHGETELKEELRQYCIQKNEPEKFIAYLQCFLEAGDSEGCVSKADINNSNLTSCISQTDSQYKVTEKFNDQSTWSGGRYPVFDVYKEDNSNYGVQGSPTLVINGGIVSSARDSVSLLNAICSAFNEQPAECSTQLSSASPSAGFGYNVSDSASAGECN